MNATASDHRRRVERAIAEQHRAEMLAAFLLAFVFGGGVFALLCALLGLTGGDL